MFQKFFSVLIILVSFSSASAQECLLTSDGDYLSKADFSGFNTATYINEKSDIFVEIGDVLVGLDGYAQTVIPCDFPKVKDDEFNDDEVNDDEEFGIITITGISKRKMPECLLVNDNGRQVHVIKSNQSALLFADNYYVYSDELLYGIYIFESNDDFLTEDKNITIENECVIPPIS